MIAKSTLAIALYSLVSSAQHKALAFSQIPHSFLSNAISTSLVFNRNRGSSSSRRAISSSSSTKVTTNNTALRESDSSSSNEPHLQTTPLPPTSSLISPNLLQRLSLKLGHGKSLRERVVHKYFHGVDTKNISQIVECFSPDGAVIRDICSLTNRDVSYENVGKLVSAEFLGERCREFLEAHPDAKVMFRYGPTCGRGRNNNWVYAHWYEEGSWSGGSQNIEPDGSPLTVQGQTRFLVGNDLKIKEIVITRTFSRWEEMLLLGKEKE